MKILIEKAVIEQALEAIETSRGQWIHSVNATVCLDTITALREALAEQAEPCSHRIADARNPVVKSGYVCIDCGALFSAADHFAEQAEQEPVSKALLLATDALVYHTEQTRPIQKTDEAIIYLRNVMAQGVSSMAFTLEDAMAKYPEISYWHNEFLKHNTTSESAEQEPVAWMNDSAPMGVFARHKEGAENFGCAIPLYAAPVRTKDLTDEEICRMWNDWHDVVGAGEFALIARAVIAADRKLNKQTKEKSK